MCPPLASSGPPELFGAYAGIICCFRPLKSGVESLESLGIHRGHLRTSCDGSLDLRITGKFPGYLSPSAGLKFADVPNGLAALSKVPQPQNDPF